MEIIDAELLPVTFRDRVSESGELVIPSHNPANYELSPETVKALADSIPPETMRSYRRWWEQCGEWCAQNNRDFLPMTSQTLTEWTRVLTETPSPKTGASLSGSYIGIAIAAVRTLHTWKGHDKPDDTQARMLLKAHKKRLSDAGRRVKKSAVVDLDGFTAMVQQCDTSTLTGLRDRLIVIWSIWAFTRRSEFAARNIPDATVMKEGLVLYFSSSKTDQAGDGVDVKMPRRDDILDPVTAWTEYRTALAERGLTTGRILRRVDRWGNIGGDLKAESVNDIIQKIAAAAGVDYDENGLKLTAHGLRASGATIADEHGATGAYLRRQGRWSPTSNVAEGYIRHKDEWKNNAVANVPTIPAPRTSDTA
ncbi:hypothetical protein [Streptomyces sp. AP-93]|uniref:hypothetical protein n=1 Tax=Streptomyces sp. AP-93 TaxID=2929048 RepID=UPI001FAFA48E|nr:hypothetical protein [Streptomyces sp. AP-93]MCJ0868115.1 hypothetical protein [Streptomyces sp. AP-93]